MKLRYIRSAKDVRDVILIAILCVVIVIALLNTVPIKRTIDAVYPGGIWEFGNLDCYAETEVRISGEYTGYLFHLFHDGDRFDGKIEIESEAYTGNDLMLPVKLHNGQYELSNIMYMDRETSECRILTIAAASMLEEGVFLPGNSDDGRQIAISFPSADREQAVSCARRLLHEDFNIY